MKCNKNLVRSQSSTNCAAAIAIIGLAISASAAAQSVRFPVLSASGRAHANGSVTVLGQFAVGRISNGALGVQQGAVPGWFAQAAPCDGDVNGDGQVDLPDLSILLSHFGTSSGASPGDGDLDGDGDVDLQDLSNLLANFGMLCL